ncbi:hypothetical protein L804_06215 [Cryptococcus deuterogattii 2001/935-1]|nr:hypothetical protein L804_06215 [Cryptococcus deuterogattii 2001/935-1]
MSLSRLCSRCLCSWRGVSIARISRWRNARCTIGTMSILSTSWGNISVSSSPSYSLHCIKIRKPIGIGRSMVWCIMRSSCLWRLIKRCLKSVRIIIERSVKLNQNVQLSDMTNGCAFASKRSKIGNPLTRLYPFPNVYKNPHHPALNHTRTNRWWTFRWR